MSSPGQDVATPARPKWGLGRSNSRTRGINFNTVSPSPTALANVTSVVNNTSALANTPNLRHGSVGCAPRLRHKTPSPTTEQSFDTPLPPLSDLDVDEQLRLLALKEMAVVELKDSISTLKTRLDSTERDLHELRASIQKSLYRELNLQQVRPRSASHGRRRSSSSSTARSETSLLSTGTAGDRLSKIWSNLAKPISFIQLLDTMLQNEFEKSLVGETRSRQRPIDPEDENAEFASDEMIVEESEAPVEHDKSMGTVSNPRSMANVSNRPKSMGSASKGPDGLPRQESQSPVDEMDDTENRVADQPHTRQYNIRRKSARARREAYRSAYRSSAHDETSPSPSKGNSAYYEYAARDRDDMFQAVSSSLWTFVNDMKTNMMSSLQEVAEPFKEPAGNGQSRTPKTPFLEHDADSPIAFGASDEEDTVDLAMYSSMRRR